MANSKDSNSRVFKIWIIASWYFSNISILFLNKYLLTNNGFMRPIFLTMCHMTACSLLSYVAIVWMKMVPMQKLRSRIQFLKMAALWVVFCISVVSGNVSLQYLPLSFTQVVDATSPFFTALYAFLVTAKREAWTTYATLIPVIVGMVMASGGEPSLHLLGFIFCVVATAARAFESVLQGTLLSSEGETMNSMNLLFYMAPISLLLLFPATLWWEKNAVGVLLALAREDIRIIWYLLFNSALTFFINLANFLVRKYTSPLTLQVLGNAKGVLAAVLSICIFKNQTTVKGFLGHVLTVTGAVLYHEAKRRHERSSNIG